MKTVGVSDYQTRYPLVERFLDLLSAVATQVINI